MLGLWSEFAVRGCLNAVGLAFQPVFVLLCELKCSGDSILNHVIQAFPQQTRIQLNNVGKQLLTQIFTQRDSRSWMFVSWFLSLFRTATTLPETGSYQR